MLLFSVVNNVLYIVPHVSLGFLLLVIIFLTINVSEGCLRRADVIVRRTFLTP